MKYEEWVWGWVIELKKIPEEAREDKAPKTAVLEGRWGWI